MRLLLRLYLMHPSRNEYADLVMISVKDFNKIQHPMKNYIVFTDRQPCFLSINIYKTMDKYGEKRTPIKDKELIKWIRFHKNRFGYMEQMLNVAKKFPNVKFEHATGYKTADNMAVYSSKFYQGRYVQGVIAGMMSEKGKAGYIASFPIPEVIRGINAFYLGATSVNPDFDIDVIWVNTWYDPAKESDAAEVLINQGSDIITQHTDSTAALQVAEKAGIKAFGQASDMIKFAPNTQLTAIIDDWGPYYVERVRAALDGTWESADTWGGMDTGMVKMAPMTNMPLAVQITANNIADAIANGVIDPFGGKFTDGELLGMSEYLPGIDAIKP